MDNDNQNLKFGQEYLRAMGMPNVIGIERQITRRLYEEDLSDSARKRLMIQQDELHDFIEEDLKINIRERYMYLGERDKDENYE
jgi:hypothetical protein